MAEAEAADEGLLLADPSAEQLTGSPSATLEAAEGLDATGAGGGLDAELFVEEVPRMPIAELPPAPVEALAGTPGSAAEGLTQRAEAGAPGGSGNWTHMAAMEEEEAAGAGAGEGSVEDEGERLEEQAFLAIRGRLTKNRREGSMLRKKLTEALHWGRGLQRELQGSRHADKQAFQQALEKQSEKAGTALAAERQRERALERKLGSVVSTLKVQALAVASLRQQEAEEKRSFETAAQDWHAHESKLQFEEDTAAQAVAMRDATIRWLQAAKQSEDAELNSTKFERTRVVQMAHEEVLEARSREQHLLEQLQKDRRDEAAHDDLMRQQLALKNRQSEDEQARADYLQRQLYSLQGIARAEVGNLTERLREAEGRQEGATRRQDALAVELQGNATEAGRLALEVRQLRGRVAEIEQAREQAQAAESKAEEEMAQAQAAANRLTSAVKQDHGAQKMAGQEEAAKDGGGFAGAPQVVAEDAEADLEAEREEEGIKDGAGVPASDAAPLPSEVA